MSKITLEPVWQNNIDFRISFGYINCAKISSVIDLLEKHGNLLGRPHSAPIEKGIFELRVRGREEIRIFFTFSKKDIYLLHAFKKKTQKIPTREIEITRKRLKSLQV